jgi:hypothetical protein
MNSWFTVKVRYTKQLDNGSFKRVSEPYLIAAMSFTDAESRAFEEVGELVRGEFSVVSIARTEIHDIFSYGDSDVWYKAKVTYESAMEGEKSKTTVQHMLVSAHSVTDAESRIKESLSTMLVDFNVPSVSVSKIVDIFPYKEDLDREISRRPMTEEDLVSVGK